ncbi:MAG: molybdopterin-dependent oxidoreductase [Pseudomonadales bacterium]|nr:molybdopterin-dependent oxidoreductase [Pseudomonadales bacterium]
MGSSQLPKDDDLSWKKTACILCSLNCGLEVQTGGKNNRDILKVRGDENHPISKGYLCNKAARLNYYQNGADRITTPLRRKADGTYEAVDWDTAIREVSERLRAVKHRHGGDKILYYGGGGQGNHLGGAYADGFLKALGVKYRANALSQEKTGEFWVNGKMFGTGIHGDFEHAEVSLFIGKNPWQSHGFAQARNIINDIKKDPQRTMIVIDPRRSETAAKADFHIALKPGTDAWCLAALVAIIVQDDLIDHAWVNQHTEGSEAIVPLFQAIDINAYASICGVDVDLLRDVANRIASATSVSAFEDLGLQQNLHSTLSSYLQRLIWLLTGNFAKKGTNNTPIPFLALNEASKGQVGGKKKKNANSEKLKKTSPVLGSKIIIGLIPCNNIPAEILTDHPNRFRAMIIESGNPVHSLADSQKMREAMRALDFSVVIDIAMTETAREADYVLPASSQFEKYENTFFNLEYPKNAFHLRAPLFEPLPGTLKEAEIYTRLLETMGELKSIDLSILKKAAKLNRALFASTFFALVATNKKYFNYAPHILYRTLGPTLPNNAAEAALYWIISHLYINKNRKYAANAGFKGLLAGEALFKAILNNRSGVVYADAGSYSESFKRVGTPSGKINLALGELFPELAKLEKGLEPRAKDYPFILSAGERRSETTNTIIRDPSWDKKDKIGTLRISIQDAENQQLKNGDIVKLSTKRASVNVAIEITEMMQPGHISLPNGVGLDYFNNSGQAIRKGIAPNELTAMEDKDIIAGTPWHKYIPARLEAT